MLLKTEIHSIYCCDHCGKRVLSMNVDSIADKPISWTYYANENQVVRVRDPFGTGKMMTYCSAECAVGSLWSKIGGPPDVQVTMTKPVKEGENHV